MKQTNQISESSGLPISTTLSNMTDQTAKILILHYKSNLNDKQIADILSLEKNEVEQTICNFAELFSTQENLMNVVNSLIKMKTNKHANSELIDVNSSELAKENAELRRQLKEAQIKAEVYQAVIDLAEQVYKIPIRKKFGAK